MDGKVLGVEAIGMKNHPSQIKFEKAPHVGLFYASVPFVRILSEENRVWEDFGFFWNSRNYCKHMAEGVGFEPTVCFHPRRFSRPLP